MGENTLKRIGYIDIAKCVAIVSVVLGHVLAYDLYGFDTVWKQSLIDLLMAMVPTVLAVAFSLGVKFVLQREPMVMRWVFGKKG